MTKTFLLLSFALVSCLLANAQNFSLSDIPLSKSDFEKKKGLSKVPAAARIYVESNFKYNVKNDNNQLWLILDAKIFVNSERSWIKEEFLDQATKEEKLKLIDHEKGHFIIALIQFKKFQKICKEYSFAKPRIKFQLDSIYKGVLATEDSLNLAYDEESNHMLNKEKQLEWITWLMKNFNSVYADEKTLRFKFQIEVAVSK